MKEKESDKELDALRKKIDGLDDQLLRLLNERARHAQKVGEIKIQRKEEIYASNRERQILDRLVAESQGPLPEESVEEIFRAIINNCRLLQKRLRIAYFGPEATFTHLAATKHFGQAAEYVPFKSIADVFDEVERDRADYGVVPIENSTEGVVNHTHDMFMESNLVICAEREDKISQCLLGVQDSLKKVKLVYSHTQPLAQCRHWLDAHLPGVALHEAASTADAAAHAALDPAAAAVASPLAAEIYSLNILASNIQDSPHNATRFLIIGKKMAGPSGRDKTSVLLSIKDRVGALHDLLMVFKEEKLNLTKIESRPTKKRAWEYVFFIDVEGHVADANMKRVLDKLQPHCLFVKILGSYPRGD
ncbi:MAG TPA: prephenate dehydratase [Elusimicrobiota bacterium]|nr:prephenate dehydratase [Elusimicrobiota bacterium]